MKQEKMFISKTLNMDYGTLILKQETKLHRLGNFDSKTTIQTLIFLVQTSSKRV